MKHKKEWVTCDLCERENVVTSTSESSQYLIEGLAYSVYYGDTVHVKDICHVCNTAIMNVVRGLKHGNPTWHKKGGE